MSNKIKPRLICDFGIIRIFTLYRRIVSKMTQTGFSQILRRSSAQEPILEATGVNCKTIHKIVRTTNILNSHELVEETSEEVYLDYLEEISSYCILGLSVERIAQCSSSNISLVFN